MDDVIARAAINRVAVIVGVGVGGVKSRIALIRPVSYTHLDVYKRQGQLCAIDLSRHRVRVNLIGIAIADPIAIGHGHHIAGGQVRLVRYRSIGEIRPARRSHDAARSAFDGAVICRGRCTGIATADRVIARPPGQHVAARAAVDLIIPRAASDGIGTGVGFQNLAGGRGGCVYICLLYTSRCV